MRWIEVSGRSDGTGASDQSNRGTPEDLASHRTENFQLADAEFHLYGSSELNGMLQSRRKMPRWRAPHPAFPRAVRPATGGTPAGHDRRGRRCSKTTGTTTTYYIYDGWNLIAEYDAADTSDPARTYTWYPDVFL